MQVTELNIKASLIPFIGAKFICVDPYNSNFVIVKRAEQFTNSHINVKMHKYLWAYILEYSKHGNEQYRSARYAGLNRINGSLIISFLHGSFSIFMKNQKPLLEKLNSLEDYTSSLFSGKKPYANTIKIDEPSKLLLLL